MICDLAEVYNIYDYRLMAPSYIAILAKGLDNNSRIKRSFINSEYTEDYLLQTLIFDRLNSLVWMFGSSEGEEEPISLYKQLTNKKKNGTQETGFESGEEFDEWRAKIIKNIKKGG